MTGRAILVTGSSRGIGRAITQRFAAGGDRVAVHHRDSAALAGQLAAELPGAGHVVVRADLADPDAVRAMVDEAAAGPGGLDVLGVALAPGFVETDMTNEHLKAERGDEIRAQSPFGRVARPAAIASAVHRLASPEAEWASGSIIDLNGASYLRT